MSRETPPTVAVAELAARDEFMEAIGAAVDQLAGKGGSDEQINTFLTAWMRPQDIEPLVFGVPVSNIDAVTLDGRSWIWVLGVVHWAQVPGREYFTLTFQTRLPNVQKRAKRGLSHGDEITVPLARVVAVKRRD